MARQTQLRPRCAFCDAEGVTEEHVWARSFTKLFEGHGVVRHHYTHPDRSRKPKVIRADAFAFKSRKFCGTCNSGWMREADDAVRSTLAAFATNTPTKLGPEAQEHLAFWATKIALVLQSRPGELQVATPERYHEFFNTRKPLVGSQVWLGANTHGDMAGALGHSLRLPEGFIDAGGFGVSHSFGYAVMHLIYHGSSTRRLHLHNDPHRWLKPVWPMQPHVSWPPQSRIPGKDLSQIATAINADSAWKPTASNA